MLDELDLAFDDQGKRRSRHRRSRRGRPAPSRPRRAGRRGRSFLALLFILVIFGALGGGAWYGYDQLRGFFVAPDYNTGGGADVVVEVKAGQFAGDIAETLHKLDVVKSPKAFIDAAKADPKSKDIQPGKYKLRAKMKAAQALQMLLEKDAKTGRLVNKLAFIVGIPEGKIALDAFAAVSEQTKIPVDELKAAAKDLTALGLPDWWLKRTDKDASGKVKSVATTGDGFYFPATYEFESGVTAKEVVKQMVAKFVSVTTKMAFADGVQSRRHITPYEALIVASIVQSEGILEEDLGKIARVLYNRAYTGDFPCSCLGLDSSVNYWYRISGKSPKDSKHFTDAELHDPANPYNTHDNPGLPPGPISNPGEKALKAALDPPEGKWLYFVTIDKAGHTGFANTFAEHQKNIEIAKKNGVL